MQTCSISRRNALKAILSASAALGAAAFMPEKWTRPVIRTGILPAHAQVSGPLVDGIRIEHDPIQTESTTLTIPGFKVYAGFQATSFQRGGHARHAAPAKGSFDPVKGALIVVSVRTVGADPVNPASYPLSKKTGADGFANFGDLEFSIGVGYEIYMKATCGTCEANESFLLP